MLPCGGSLRSCGASWPARHGCLAFLACPLPCCTFCFSTCFPPSERDLLSCGPSSGLFRYVGVSMHLARRPKGRGCSALTIVGEHGLCMTTHWPSCTTAVAPAENVVGGSCYTDPVRKAAGHWLLGPLAFIVALCVRYFVSGLYLCAARVRLLGIVVLWMLAWRSWNASEVTEDAIKTWLPLAGECCSGCSRVQPGRMALCVRWWYMACCGAHGSC